jgi:opacity protein-like surface antigen
MRKRLLFAILAMALATASFAAVLGITGKWKGNLDMGDGGHEVTYTFNADGEKLTGNVEAAGTTYNITEGKIKGDSLLFNVDYNGESIPHTAKCYADSIGLNINVNGQIFHVQLKHAQ